MLDAAERRAAAIACIDHSRQATLTFFGGRLPLVTGFIWAAAEMIGSPLLSRARFYVPSATAMGTLFRMSTSAVVEVGRKAVVAPHNVERFQAEVAGLLAALSRCATRRANALRFGLFCGLFLLCLWPIQVLAYLLRGDLLGVAGVIGYGMLISGAAAGYAVWRSHRTSVKIEALRQAQARLR